MGFTLCRGDLNAGFLNMQAWSQFMETCMARMRDADASDAQLQSVLRLLSRFLEEVRKEKVRYDPDSPAMLLQAQLEVQWQGGTFYLCTVDHFNAHNGEHHCTYTDGDKRWYTFTNKSGVAKVGGKRIDMVAVNKSGTHNVRLKSWDEANVKGVKEFNALKRYPRRALTYNKKYFDCLFALIGRDNAETVTAAWNLLTAKRVPTNPDRRIKLALCGASDEEIDAALAEYKSGDEIDPVSGGVLLQRTASAGGDNPLRQRTNTICDIDTLPESAWEELLGNGDRSPMQVSPEENENAGAGAGILLINIMYPR